MTKFYQRYQIATDTLIGVPGPLPGELVGLDDATLLDLSWADPLLGYRGQGFHLVDVPIDQIQARALAAAKLQHDQRFLAGFPLTIQGQAETLQMRPEDLINWLVFKDSCQDAIDANQGNAQSMLPLRTTDNSEYVLTYNDGKKTMIAMRAYGAMLMRNHWLLKDAINRAKSQAEVDAVDVSAGWPVSTFSV